MFESFRTIIPPEKENKSYTGIKDIYKDIKIQSPHEYTTSQ